MEIVEAATKHPEELDNLQAVNRQMACLETDYTTSSSLYRPQIYLQFSSFLF